MAHRLKYRPEDLTNPNPIGDNNLSPEALYYQRSLYNEVAYPTKGPQPLDIWSGKIYYGKIDQLQNTVIPRVANLDLITSTAAPNLFALAPVVYAFEAFVRHMQNAIIQSKVNPDGNTKLLYLKAFEAYVNPAANYEHYLNRLFTAFDTNLPRPEKNKIIDLQTFTAKYVEFLKTTAEYSPITKTNYLLTQHVNIFGSGLTIAIDDGPPEDDSYKNKHYLKDPNFAFFVGCAKKYGFIVDKNIPWRLTFDLFTNASLRSITSMYIEPYGLGTKENFFPAYYTPTYFTDAGELRRIIVNSYQRFVELNPLRVEQCLQAFKRGTFEVINHTRLPFDPSAAAIDSVLSDKYIADLYLSLRHTESQEPFRITAKDRRSISEIYVSQPNKRMTPLQNVAAYVNLRFRNYIYSANYFTYASEKAVNYLLGLDTPTTSGIISITGRSPDTGIVEEDGPSY